MPDSQRQVRRGIKQVRIDGLQAARTKPLVMTSKNQSWSTLRRSMSVGCSRDETADISLLHEIALPVLLWRTSCPSKFGLQMPALDPARNDVRIDPQHLSKAVGGVTAPVVLEFHSFQLEMDGGRAFLATSCHSYTGPCRPSITRSTGTTSRARWWRSRSRRSSRWRRETLLRAQPRRSWTTWT